jgi:hypothetical protein
MPPNTRKLRYRPLHSTIDVGRRQPGASNSVEPVCRTCLSNLSEDMPESATSRSELVEDSPAWRRSLDERNMFMQVFLYTVSEGV